MKDYLGNELYVGDRVLMIQYSKSSTPSYTEAIIEKFTSKMVYVKIKNDDGSECTVLKSPQFFARLSSSGKVDVGKENIKKSNPKNKT